MEREKERIVQLRAMPYEEYLLTPEWQAKREQALARALYRCQICHTPENLNVHHASYEHLGNEPLTDLIVLCESDHSWFHYRLAKNKHMSQVGIDPEKDPIIATGFQVIDPPIRLQKGQVLLVGSRSEQGVLPFVLNVGHRAAVIKKQSVAIFSLTMSKVRLTQQMIALDTRVEPARMSDEHLGEHKYERIVYAVGQLEQASCWMSDTVLTVEDIAHQLEEACIENHPIDLVIIDSLGLLESGRNENAEQRLLSVSRALKLIARKWNVAIIVACTLPQVPSKQAEVPLRLSDVRNAELYADVVLLLSLQPERPTLLEVNIAKNVNGRLHSVNLFYANDGTMCIDDFEVTPLENEEA